MKSEVQKHFDKISGDYDYYKRKNGYYYNNLKILLSKIIPKNKTVLEIGCGTGDLITYLKPKKGWGMDLSEKMVKRAKIKYKHLKNLTFSTEYPTVKFDYVFMADVIEHLESPEDVFKKISKLMDKKSLFVITTANPILEPLLLLGEKIGLKMPEGPHIRIKYDELKIMLEQSGFKIIKHDYKLLLPIYIPLLTSFINKYLEKYLKKICVYRIYSYKEDFLILNCQKAIKTILKRSRPW